MIETTETLEGILQETGALAGDASETSSLNGNLDSVGNILRELDVNFYDYDGTLVYSYTADNFLNMFAFPPNPVHKDLVSKGWNWSLENAREYVLNYGKLDLGQLYDVVDNGLIFDIKLSEAFIKSQAGEYTLSLEIIQEGQSQSGFQRKNMLIDWGDGSEPVQSSDDIITHGYTTSGEYRIKILPTDDTNFFVDLNDLRDILTSIHFGSQYLNELGGVDFNNAPILKTVTISYKYYGFNNCRNLKYIVIPRGETYLHVGYEIDIVNYLANCPRLKISLSDTLEDIYFVNAKPFDDLYVPKSCYQFRLKNISGTINTLIIPDTVSSIELYNLADINNLVCPNVIPNDGYFSIMIDFDDGEPTFTNNINNSLKLPTNTIISTNYDLSNSMVMINGYIGEYLYIPPGITTIDLDYNSFIQSYDLKVLDFKDHTQVPTLGDYSLRINYRCIVVVPDNLYSSWSSNSAWEGYTIIKKSDYDSGNFTPPGQGIDS